MIQQARKRLLIAALTFVLSGAMAVPAQAGIIPWAWDTVFGPVGSIRARRACNVGVGYGFRNRCGYGPMSYGAMSYGSCGSCGGGCSPCSGGSCGISCGCGYGGYGSALSMGNCSSCASGQCGVNFSDPTPGNLVPRPENPPLRSNAPSTNPPTFDSGTRNNSGIGNSGGTSINNNFEDRPRVSPEEFPAERQGESIFPNEKRTPSPGRPALPSDEEDGAGYHPAPINGLGGKVTWSSKSQIERQGGRTLGNRSVQVTRQGAFPNSKWEVADETREVAKK